MATARRPGGPGGVGGTPPAPTPEATPPVEKPTTPEPEERSQPALGPRHARPVEAISEKQREKKKNQDALLGEGRIGDDRVTSSELAAMGTLVGARHLMVLLAKKRGEARERVLREIGDLLIGIGQPALVRRLLSEMPDAGRIVDIYPLEVLAYVLERRSDLIEGFFFEEFILNKAELEARAFVVEEPIRVQIPLAMRVRAFALEGGGSPGYCFAPGAPGEYHMELGAAGTFHLLVRGEVRKRSLVDRVVLRVEEAPDDR